MLEEEKQLLLQDLCAKLPYGVVVNTPKGDGHLCSINQTIFGNEYGVNIEATKRDYFNDNECNIKPYLRTLSSMTEDEKEELIKNFWGSHTAKDTFEELSLYLSKHFDINELIPRGLAIEVTEKNNPYKE